jgi:DNA repair exonuclease SbcCD ATPase subunit
MPDRIEVLREAAQARHDATLRRAEATLRTLVRHGAPITFRGFADAAGVSRSWLYRQPQLREQIEQLRQQRSSRAPTVPSAERASTDSLRQQIQTYREEIARLSKENQALYEQLARQLGTARAAAVTAPF